MPYNPQWEVKNDGARMEYFEFHLDVWHEGPKWCVSVIDDDKNMLIWDNTSDPVGELSFSQAREKALSVVKEHIDSVAARG